MKTSGLNKAQTPYHLLIAVILIVTTAFYWNPLPTGIQGTVTNRATGSPLSQVRIRILKDGSLKMQTMTDNQGRFRVVNLQPGTYQAEATQTGYQTVQVKSVTVAAEKMTTVHINMEARVQVPVSENMQQITPEYTDKMTMKHETVHTTGSAYEQNKQYAPAVGYTRDEGLSREGYDYISENEFNPALETPLSTFSIDVDRASYANVRRFLTKGTWPPVDAVRMEEMINYFSYQYDEPKNEHPFAIHTEVSTCPWNKEHRLALIGIQGKRIRTGELPPSNLTFLVDVSGSMMHEDKLPLLKRSLGLLVNELREKDRVALVVYAGNAGLVLPSTSGSQKEKIMEAINNLEAGGSTAGGAGIQLAYRTARENFLAGGNNRVILATDGDFNVGVSSDGELVRLIEEKRKDGIFLTVLGFGTGNYQDAKMEKLADKGNGNYAYIDNIMEARKTLVQEMGGTLLTIAKDVKIQVEFNPALVREYKLIGYENRLLHDRDFNDDSKDAGELGSGHTVTALYEIIPADGQSSGSTVDPLKYQLKNLSDDNNLNRELFTVKFRYKKPDGDESKLLTHIVKNQSRDIRDASENMRFSSAVAAFGMLLRNSKFKGEANFKLVSALAGNAKTYDPQGYRAEFIRLVETAAALSANTAKE